MSILAIEEINHSCLYATTFLAVSLVLIVISALYVLYFFGKPRCNKSTQPLSTFIVLGSGGHTAEMMNILSVLQMDRFMPRFYIAAATDNLSLQKACVFKDSLLDKKGIKGVSAQFLQIYRSREVGQSYVTTLLATAHAFWLMIKIRPQVLQVLLFCLAFSYGSNKVTPELANIPQVLSFQILCNGPGTCIPLCVIAFLFKIMGIRWSSIFYVESISRVRRLSLSTLLLYKLHIAVNSLCNGHNWRKNFLLCWLSHVVD